MKTITYINILIISVAALSVTHASSEDIDEKGLIIQGVDVTVRCLMRNWRENLSTLAEIHGRRPKRFIFTALALFVGKAFLKSYVVSKVAAVGKVGAAAAKVYTTYDTVDTAKDVYDTFNSLRPDNVESRVVESGHNRGERVMTGEIGDIKVIARSHGPSGLPTLELNGEKK